MALAGITSTRIFQNPHGQIWLCGWLHSWWGQEHTLATKSHGRGREWRAENRNPTYTKCASFPSLTAVPHGRWCWWDNFPEKKCNAHGSSMVPKWWTLWLIHAFKSVRFTQMLRWLEWWRSYTLRSGFQTAYDDGLKLLCPGPISGLRAGTPFPAQTSMRVVSLLFCLLCRLRLVLLLPWWKALSLYESCFPWPASIFLYVKVKFAQSSPTLCNPMDYTVDGILQARILEWVAFPFSRGSPSLPRETRDQPQVSRTAGGFFTSWTTKENLSFPFSFTRRFPHISNCVITVVVYLEELWPPWKEVPA